MNLGYSESSWHNTWKEIVSRIRLVHTERQASDLLSELASPERPRILAFINAHGMNQAAADRRFADALLGADTLLRDGSGIAVLYRLLGMAPGLNMNGTDFIPRVLAAYRAKRVALWGTSDPYLSDAANRIETEFDAQVVSREHGFHEAEYYVQLSRRSEIDLVLLGMGMPKQEVIAARLCEEVKKPVLVICGGAIIDFLGGKVERAPVWIRRLGMEWTYRLALEPKRLFRRYVLGNPLFLARAALFRAKEDRMRPSSG